MDKTVEIYYLMRMDTNFQENVLYVLKKKIK